jgi:hypothetical protein
MKYMPNEKKKMCAISNAPSFLNVIKVQQTVYTKLKFNTEGKRN